MQNGSYFPHNKTNEKNSFDIHMLARKFLCLEKTETIFLCQIYV